MHIEVGWIGGLSNPQSTVRMRFHLVLQTESGTEHQNGFSIAQSSGRYTTNYIISINYIVAYCVIFRTKLWLKRHSSNILLFWIFWPCVGCVFYRAVCPLVFPHLPAASVVPSAFPRRRDSSEGPSPATTAAGRRPPADWSWRWRLRPRINRRIWDPKNWLGQITGAPTCLKKRGGKKKTMTMFLRIRCQIFSDGVSWKIRLGIFWDVLLFNKTCIL